MATRSRRRRQDRQLVLRWVLALSITLIAMIGLAVSVKNAGPEPAVQKPLPPEPSNLEPNPFTAEDFAWENGLLTCLSEKAVAGIDVSYYQGEIDWQQVKQAGIEFAFVRVAYRGTRDGILREDTMARQNLTQARAAGIQVGAYVFSQALNRDEAREEAEFALNILKRYSLDLPVVYDWEYVSEEARTGGMTSETLMTCVDAFTAHMEQSGYPTMVYFNLELSKTLLDVTALDGKPMWFAMYDQAPGLPYKPDYWQYSDEGTIPGIEGYVDLDLYFPE